MKQDHEAAHGRSNGEPVRYLRGIPTLARLRRPLLSAIAMVLVLAPGAHASVAGEPLVAEPAPERVFPVTGKVHYGGFAAHFGGGRDHQGQDVFADCGTPLVAAAAGKVIDAKYHGSAGNYVVIEAEGGRHHFYAHLSREARVDVGDRVRAGDRLGSVGQSGNAWDCHLHFEVWTAPGWYRGGHPIDPLPLLRSLAE
jgi:murein DD-endopeptidase MepM/ murein hydrolase activator NlpD